MGFKQFIPFIMSWDKIALALLELLELHMGRFEKSIRTFEHMMVVNRASLLSVVLFLCFVPSSVENSDAAFLPMGALVLLGLVLCELLLGRICQEYAKTYIFLYRISRQVQAEIYMAPQDRDISLDKLKRYYDCFKAPVLTE